MSDEQTYQIDKLSKALEVSNRTIQSLESKLANAKQMVDICEREKKSWQEQKVLQEKIIQQQLEASDNKVRQLQSEIMDLKAKLKAA